MVSEGVQLLHTTHMAGDPSDIAAARQQVGQNLAFQTKVSGICKKHFPDSSEAVQEHCREKTSDIIFCMILRQKAPSKDGEEFCKAVPKDSKKWDAYVAEGCDECPKPPPAFLQVSQEAPEDELAKEMTHDLEMNFNKIAPFGKEDTAKEL